MLVHAARIALGPILYAQARRLRTSALQLPEPSGPRQGVEGAGQTCLRLLVTGDSSAAGVGAETQDDALARPLARDLALRLGARIEWNLVAQSGVNSEQLLHLIRGATAARADIAIVIVGVNDVTGEVPLGRALRWRAEITAWLLSQAQARQVLFTSMPEMQRFPLIPQPLAWYAGMHARRNNAAQARWARSLSNVGHIDLSGFVRPEWMARDGFHPAPPLYARLATRIGEQVAARTRAQCFVDLPAPLRNR